jgi:beta-glucosidase
LSKTQMKANEKIEASVTITNTGNCDGEEVVQLYIRDMVASVVRPIKELKGFQKIFLKKGERKEVKFILSVDDLKFYTNELKYIAESGEFKVMIGSNSQDLQSMQFLLK